MGPQTQTASQYPQGVSVSRVPVIATKSGPILVLDPAKMPPSQPLAEAAFRKTRYEPLQGPLRPNETRPYGIFPNARFEFENRTSGPIDPSAIKKVITPWHSEAEPFKGYEDYIRKQYQIPESVPIDIVPVKDMKLDRVRNLLAGKK